MIVNPFAGDRPVVSQDTGASRERGEAFQRAYEKVFDERSAQAPPRPAGNAYAVRAGDTLTNIVRARLATAGTPADSAAVRQGIAQVVKANEIRNPDRIFAGQKLDLTALDAMNGNNNVVAKPGAAFPRIADTSPTGSARAASAHEIRYADQPDQDDMGPADVEQLAVIEPALLPPAASALAQADSSSENDNAGITPTAMRQIAVYEQRAADVPAKPADEKGGLPDIVYKGVVGKVLDAIPMDPSTRTALQRTNTVVSGALTVRSLGALAGVGGPLVAVAGLLWGIFSSRQINADDSKPAAGTNPVADATQIPPTKVADASK